MIHRATPKEVFVMHPLKLFFLRNGDWASQSLLAESMGVSRHTIHNVVTCRCLVSYEWGKKIEEYTKGTLKWQDLVEYNGLHYKSQKKTDTVDKSASAPLVSAGSES